MLQEYNPKNKDIFIHVNGELLPRSRAKVSVFDSIVQNGDGVWEGLRVYPEGIVCYDKHLTRLQEGAHALGYEGVPSKDKIKKAIKETLDANGMDNDTHIRLTLTRGEKVTSGMDSRLNQSGCCLIVLAEWKKKVYDFSKGIKAISSSIRRSIPAFLDSKICLGFNSDDNIKNGLPTERTFEGIAYGCVVLTDCKMAEEATDGVAVYVKDYEDLQRQVDFYLHNESARKKKQKEGYEYALNKGTYYTVAKNFINSIEKLYPN